MRLSVGFPFEECNSRFVVSHADVQSSLWAGSRRQPEPMPFLRVGLLTSIYVFTGCSIRAGSAMLRLRLRHPLHSEFLALLGAVEKIKIDQLLIRKSCLLRQSFEIVHNLRTQVDSHDLFLAGLRLVPLLPPSRSFGVK